MSSVTANSETANLTPPITIPTSIPFPLWTTTDPSQPPTRSLSTTKTITANVCSEFTQYIAPATPVSAQHKLAIVQDGTGNPIVFSIGSDERLYCIQHIPGASSGWQSVDITPTTQTGYRAVAFDVVQDMSTKNVNLAVAVTTGATGTNTDLYTVFGLSIFYSPVDWAQLAWNLRNNNLGRRSVSTMQLSEVAAVRGGAYPFVLVGTSISGSSDLLASDYVVSLDPSSTTPWSQAPLSKVASSVIQVSPGHMRLPFGHGVFTLFQDANYINEGFLTQYGKDAGNSCAFNSFPTFDANGNITDAGTLVVVLLRKLGQVARGFTTLVNSKGDSDLVVAGANGLGFYPSAKLDQDPTAVLLPNVSFHQVTASQWGTQISILATSTSGQLYYIQGSRTSATADPTFTYSGLPIRTGVSMLAVQRNAMLGGGATEFVCVDSDAGVMHVWKDPTSTIWGEQKLLIASTEKQTSIPAFISQIKLTDVDGNGLGESRQIDIISSDASYLTINNCTYQVNPRTVTTIPTDSQGQLSIVYPADVTLSAPTLTLRFSEPTQPTSPVATFDVCPVQRIARKLGRIQSASDIMNAVDNKGNKIFPPGSVDSNGKPLTEGAFDALSSVLSNAPSLFASLGASAELLGEDIVGQAKDLWVTIKDDPIAGFERDMNSDTSLGNKVKDFFVDTGDLFVSIGKKVVALDRFVLSVVEDVIVLYLEVQGTFIKLEIETVAAFAIILREVTGIDLVKYLDWLGFLFDWDNIMKTQKILANYATTSLKTFGRVMSGNGAFFAAMIKDIKATINDVIPDMREVTTDTSTNPSADGDGLSSIKAILGPVFDVLFNNPIASVFFDILGRLMEAFSGQDEIIVPGVDALFTAIDSIVSKAFASGVDNISKFITDICAKLNDVCNKTITIGQFVMDLLSDTIWTIIDTLAMLLMDAVDVFDSIVVALIDFLTGAWTIPVLTSLWKFVTNTELTVMNVLTIPAAFALNIAAQIKFGKLPFDSGAWPDPTNSLPSMSSLILDPSIFQSNASKQQVKAMRIASTAEVQEDVAEDGEPPVDPDEETKLRNYRLSDAACGAVANLLGCISSIVEILYMMQMSQLNKVAPNNMPSPPNGQVNQIDPNPLLKFNFGGRNYSVRFNSVSKALKSSASNIKLVLDIGLLITHLISGSIMSQVEMPSPRRKAWLGIKFGLGVPLIIAGAGCSYYALNNPPESPPRHGWMLAGGLCTALGNICHTGVTGIWEFALCDKATWDDFRFVGDLTETVGAVVGFCANVADSSHNEEVALGFLVADLGINLLEYFDIAPILLGQYVSNPVSLEETGKLKTE
ncbi:hypothetical protein R3P38DRAFT_3284352 [Favolaschia claudopus]|uniref:Uncharacterized protein n=1 Tax=Favolaschia claudopus TaxID=2862362 RepID=A0AAW0A5J3_9AGAR